MQAIKDFLIGIGNQIKAIITGIFDSVAKSVVDLKKFLLSVVLVMIALDAVLLGKLKFIAFLMDTAGNLLKIVASGGWSLVVIALIILLFLEKKKQP